MSFAHLLPDSADQPLSYIALAMKPQGAPVVSFPNILPVLKTGNVQAHQFPVLSLNSLTCRNDHQFMCDSELFTELLRLAEFTDIRTTSFQTAPRRRSLHQDRMPESAYVISTM